jgi:lipoate-protein ligase A
MTPQTPDSNTRRAARLLQLADVSPEAEASALVSLSRRPGTSALVIASSTGDAAMLGRHQRPGRSGFARELRRVTGGRSTRCGDGVASVCALIPDPAAWLDETGALSGPRLLNRMVRGLLSGLSRLGLAATYQGRDFVSVNGRRIASIALGRETSGVVIFQAAIGVDAPCTTAERAPSWPGLPEIPEPTWLARERGRACDLAELAGAMAEGFSERFALALDPLSRDEVLALADGSTLPVVDDSLAGLVGSGPVATPIGELEAYAALDAQGRLTRVRLCGDWMAAETELHALEAALVGETPESARVRELCAAWLETPAAGVIGLSDAAALADAIARGARAYSARSPSSA